MVVIINYRVQVGGFCSRSAWEREPTCWSRGFSRWAGRDDL